MLYSEILPGKKKALSNFPLSPLINFVLSMDLALFQLVLFIVCCVVLYIYSVPYILHFSSGGFSTSCDHFGMFHGKQQNTLTPPHGTLNVSGQKCYLEYAKQ